jgi:hypothetical protein
MKKNNGGPALSITLRQWYAGMALQGELANPKTAFNEAAQFAEWALEVADALIEAEQKAENT